jgi:hypothetical protein
MCLVAFINQFERQDHTLFTEWICESSGGTGKELSLREACEGSKVTELMKICFKNQIEP